MNLAARLTKLEQSAGKGKWCSVCRLMLRTSPPVTTTFAANRNALHQVKRTCQFCGNQYHAELPQSDELYDRLLCLYYSYDDECSYTDEKAAALRVWVSHYRNRSPEEGKRKEKNRQAAHSRRRAAKPTSEQKLRQRVTEEVRELYGRWHKEMKAKHGEPFSHLVEMEQKIACGFYEWSAASHELERWRAWAMLERIIFGEPLPETAARIVEYEAKAATEEAEKQRQEAERQEREQRMYSTSANRPPPSGQWG